MEDQHNFEKIRKKRHEQWENKNSFGEKRGVGYLTMNYHDLAAYLEKGEKLTQRVINLTRDFQEGISAFIEKRKLQFKVE